MRIKTGDTIKVLIGKDKGKTGKVERVDMAKDMVLVENMNQFKRHLKSRAQNQPSEIVTLTKPLRSANVALVCPNCKKVTRVGVKIEKDKKVRMCKKCKKVIN